MPLPETGTVEVTLAGLATGDLATGQVIFTPCPDLIGDTASNVLYYRESLTVELVEGAASAELAATDNRDLTMTGWHWRAVFRIDAETLRPVCFHVPAGETVYLADVVNVECHI